MISIVDYGAGNVGSVVKAVRHLGFAVEIVSGPEKLVSSEKIILPGQGHFGSMIRALHESRLYDALKEAMEKGCRYLGICLGLQLLYEGSEEAPRVPGMGLIPGNVKRLQDVFKIPHIGWSQIELRKTDGLLTGIKSGGFFYFLPLVFSARWAGLCWSNQLRSEICLCCRAWSDFCCSIPP